MLKQPAAVTYDCLRVAVLVAGQRQEALGHVGVSAWSTGRNVHLFAELAAFCVPLGSGGKRCWMSKCP